MIVKGFEFPIFRTCVPDSLVNELRLDRNFSQV